MREDKIYEIFMLKEVLQGIVYMIKSKVSKTKGKFQYKTIT